MGLSGGWAKSRGHRRQPSSEWGYYEGRVNNSPPLPLCCERPLGRVGTLESRNVRVGGGQEPPGRSMEFFTRREPGTVAVSLSLHAALFPLPDLGTGRASAASQVVLLQLSPGGGSVCPHQSPSSVAWLASLLSLLKGGEVSA